MRPLVLSLAASLFGAAAADAASPYPVEIERQRGETLHHPAYVGAGADRGAEGLSLEGAAPAKGLSAQDRACGVFRLSGVRARPGDSR